MARADFLIVGQGLAGSLLAYELISRRKSVVIYDLDELETSSKRAAGIFNPVTGRKMVKTWLADELFPTLQDYYSNLEKSLEGHFLHSKEIYRPFLSTEEQNDWQGKLASGAFDAIIQNVHEKSREMAGVVDPHGGVSLKNCGYIDLPAMLACFKKWFEALGVYRSELFNYHNLLEDVDKVSYQGQDAGKIVFCEGPGVVNNPFFRELRFKLVKGELLNLKATLEQGVIVNRGVFMIPKSGFLQVGSTYDHQDLTWEPTENGRKEIVEKLSKIFTGDYSLLSQQAGLRPATFDRRPYLGMAQNNPRVGIFNGFGTKGVSLAPFFAKKMADFLINGQELPQSVALYR